ncbi:hypothetical protein ACLOJK_040577 [Asimina triloba]
MAELVLSARNRDEELSVLPVVGMGGLGKTTLAQFAYNDRRLEGTFDSKFWVCVSDEYDLRRLLKAIVESASNDSCDFQAVHLLLNRRLQETQRGKRFLLVLDENHEKWERLKKFLPVGERGSTVMVTARSDKVVSIMGTLPSYHPARLSHGDCWRLFKQRA